MYEMVLITAQSGTYFDAEEDLRS